MIVIIVCYGTVGLCYFEFLFNFPFFHDHILVLATNSDIPQSRNPCTTCWRISYPSNVSYLSNQGSSSRKRQFPLFPSEAEQI